MSAVTMEERIEEVLRPLIEEVRAGVYVPTYAEQQQDSTVLGVIVAKFLHWDGDAIIACAGEALEDANFHDEAEQVRAMGGG